MLIYSQISDRRNVQKLSGKPSKQLGNGKSKTIDADYDLFDIGLE